MLHEALRRAVGELRERLGPDLATWRYGRVHTLTLRHTLGGVAALPGGAVRFLTSEYSPALDRSGVRVWDHPSGRTLSAPRFTAAPAFSALSPDGGLLVQALSEGVVQVHDALPACS